MQEYKTVESANAAIETVARYLETELPDLPESFTGARVTIPPGIVCDNYSCSGISIVGLGNLPVYNINYKRLAQADQYRRDVLAIAKKIAIEKIVTKSGTIYKRVGSRFVRIGIPATTL